MTSAEPDPNITRLPGNPPSPYEAQYGFSRVVSFGDMVLVGGTTAVDNLGFVIGLTPYEQAAEILRKIAVELDRLGTGIRDVVQARAYVTDISRADDVGRAFGEVFEDIRPLFTMVEVSGLIDPRMSVEIEVVAYRPTH